MNTPSSKPDKDNAQAREARHRPQPFTGPVRHPIARESTGNTLCTKHALDVLPEYIHTFRLHEWRPDLAKL